MHPTTVNQGPPARTPWRIACALLFTAAVAQAPLQYNFKVGDQLVYERRATVSSLTDGQPISRIVDQVQLWCLEKKGNEALILFDLIRIRDGQREPIRGVLCHVDDRGHRRMPDVTPTRAYEMPVIFEVVPLMRRPLQDASLWHTPPGLLGLTRQCRRVGPDDRHDGHIRVDFAVEYPHEIAEVLGRSCKGSYWFDPAARIVTRVEYTQEDRSAGRRTENTIVLRLYNQRPSSWLGRRRDEAWRYLITVRHEDRLLAELTQKPEDVEQTLARLQRLWSGRLTEFSPGSGAPFELLARANRTHLSADADGLRADAAYARRWLNQPALPWSLQTPAGETLTSEQVRDRPIIECLWSMETPGFVATLAALHDLQEESGDTVRIVCLNMDSNIPSARRLLAELPSGLTHVLAGPLRAVEQPVRLPVVRVLDSQGTIRRLWVGWRASYDYALRETRRLAD